MAENIFEQFGFEDEESEPITRDVPETGPNNFFSVFESEPDAVDFATPEPPAASLPEVQPVPGVKVDWFVDTAYQELDRQEKDRKRSEQDSLNQKRGNSFLQGITDPQQYGEFAKGIIPGAVRFTGTTLKGAAGLQSSSMQASKTDAERQIAIFDSLDRGEQPADATGFEIEVSAYQGMTPEQRQAYRERLGYFASPVTTTEDRTLFKAGQKVTDYAETILPADPAYREAVGRQLGEGIGSMIAGLPAAWLGPVPATVFFGSGGSGEAVERAIQHDKQLRKEGKAGLTEEQIATAALWGIGPGVTDVAPIELLLGRLKIPKPFQKIFATAIGRIGGQAFVEGVQEGGQQFLQNFIAQEIYNPDQSLTEGVVSNAELGAGVGGIAQAAKETAKVMAKSFGGKRSGGTQETAPEDLTIEEIAEAIDNPMDQGQQVARETKQDKLDVAAQPVEAAQEAQAAPETAVVEPEAVAQPEDVAPVTPQAEPSDIEGVRQWAKEQYGPSAKVSRYGTQYSIGIETDGVTDYITPDGGVSEAELSELGYDRETSPTEAEPAALPITPEELQVAEQEIILPAIEEVDSEIGSPVIAEAYGRLTPDEKTEIISRISENEEDIADLIEEMAIRNEDLPTIAAMAMRRGATPEQIQQLRSVIQQASPELATVFDELVAALPKPRQAKATKRAPQRKAAGSTVQDFARASSGSEIAERFNILQEDAASLLKRKAFTGKAKTLVERLAKKASEGNKHVLNNDWDALGRVVGDMAADAAALTSLDARPTARVLTQWVDTAGRLAREGGIAVPARTESAPERAAAQAPSAAVQQAVERLDAQTSPADLTRTVRELSGRLSAQDWKAVQKLLQERVRERTSQRPATELRQSFASILNSKTPKSKWASELGVTDAELAPLIDEAVRKGFLRRDRNGNVRRVPQSQHSGNFAAMVIPDNLPETIPGEGDVALTDAAVEKKAAIMAALERATAKILPPAVAVDFVHNIKIATLRKEDQLLALREEAAFRRWFGASKVVDENGEPLVVYHGTKGDISAFDASKRGTHTKSGGSEFAFFFTSKPSVAETYAEKAPRQDFIAEIARLKQEQASLADERDAILFSEETDWSDPAKSERLEDLEYRGRDYQHAIDALENYARRESGGMHNAEFLLKRHDVIGEARAAELAKSSGESILPVYLSAQNPMIVEAGGKVWHELPEPMSKSIADAKAAGHDGVIFRNIYDPLRSYMGEMGVSDIVAVFEPTQIKSIYNRGTFDPTDPRISYALRKTESDPSAIVGEEDVPYPPRTEFSDTSIDDIGLMLGEVPGWGDWAFDKLNDFQVRRIRSLSDAEKRSRLEAAMQALAQERVHIELLPDDMRVATWKDGEWIPVAQGLDEQAQEHVDTVQAIAIDAKGNRFMPVVDFNQLYDGFWRNSFVEGTDVATDRTATGREGAATVEGQPAPRVSPATGEGIQGTPSGDLGPGLRDRALARIIRQESASLDASGNIIAGRPSRSAKASAKGGEGVAIQRAGRTEPFAIDGFEGRVTAKKLIERDEREGNLARLTYEIFEPGTMKPYALPLGEMEITQRADGAWEVGYVEIRAPRNGIGTKLYNAIETDLGIRMSPSGVLSDSGYAFWQKRSPASVQWHVKTPTFSDEAGEMYFSPRKISDELDRIGSEIRKLSAGTGSAMRIPAAEREEFRKKYVKERGELIKLYAKLPLEARAAKDQMFALTAFHGSPHDFDRFDLSRIGTGEGAQAFGHGLYFAENEMVAKRYRESLKRNNRVNSATERFMHLEIDGKPLGQQYDIDSAYVDELSALVQADDQNAVKNLLGEKLSRWQQLTSDATYPFPAYAADKSKAYQELIARLERGGEIRDAGAGAVYEVEIDVEPEQLLDYDAPLSEQSGEVRTALELKFSDQLESLSSDDFTATGADLYNSIVDRIAGNRKLAGEYGAGDQHQARAFQLQASEALRDAGIPGIRYLDQGSRGSGDGTRNIVIFDDTLVKITKKNGKPVTAEERQQVVDQMFALRSGESGPRTPTEVKVYHGTPRAGYERFSFENAPVEAVFFTDAPDAASEYAGQRFLEPPTRAERYLGYTEPDVNVAVYPVFIETKNFKTIDWGGQTFNDGASEAGLDLNGEIALAKQEGYEGLIVNNVEDTGGFQNQYVTWTEGTVRSAISGEEMFAMRRGSRQPEALAQTDIHLMTISIAMRAVEAEAKAKGVSTEQEAIRVLRHEAVELFKGTGLFTEKEWNTLKTAARRNGWVETTGVRDAYTRVYGEAFGVGDQRLAVSTATPAFQKWFRDSKVVDEQGQPLVVYHGTKQDIESFQSGADGGIHFGTSDQANMRAPGGNVVPAYLHAKKLKRTKDSEGNWKKTIARAKREGNDGIVYLNRYEGIPREEFQAAFDKGITQEQMDSMPEARFRKMFPSARDSYIVFEPTQIKSAIGNRGTFDPNDPRIAYALRGEQGEGAAVQSSPELEDLLIKEAIAEQYSEFHLGRKQFKGVVAEVFQRIKDFIARVASFARGEGFQTWEDVFERIDQGEFKARFEEAFPELAPAPATGTRAIQATAGKIADSPVRTPSAGIEQPTQSLADLVNAFNRALGITVRQGRLDPGLKARASSAGQDVRGQTSMETGVIRLRVPNEIDTLAHEGGHALENRFKGDLDAMKLRHAAELTPLASPGPDALSEGFAEWFRRYVTNPAASKRTAPGFEQEFEDFLDAQDPDMLASLQSIRDGYQEWISAPSGGAVASSIATTVAPGSVKEAVREFKEEGLRNTFHNWIDRIYTAVFDDLHPVRLTVDGLLEIAKKNFPAAVRDKIDVKAANNPYKLLRLARDGYAAGHMDLLHGVHAYQSLTPTGPSLREAIATAFGGLDKSQWNEAVAKDFGAYLVSRRMVQEWGRFQNGDISAPPDKFSLADHQQSIKDFEAAYPGFAQGAQQVHAFLNNMLLKKRDAGLITSELYDQLIARQDYVPVMRDMSDRGGVEGRSAARKDKYSIISKFRGSQRDVINPLESIAKDAYETSMIIARNDALKALDALARAAGPDGGKFAERIPAREMKATQVNVQEAIKSAARDAGVDPADVQIMLQAVDDQLGGNAIAQIWRAGEVSEKGEAIVYLWENGERIPIRLADGQFGHDILHAVTGLNRESVGWFVNLLSLPSTILRMGVTASADFIGANFLRDQVSAWILTRDFVPFYDGAVGIYNDLTLSDVSRIYSRTGGIMGGANVAAQHESRIKREILQLRRKGIRFTLNPMTRDFWRMTEFAETGTRLAVFQKAFDRAKKDNLSDWESAVEAAFVARDYIDFGRRGSRMLGARRLIPFFNAALQGLDRGIRGMRGKVDADKVLRTAISPYIKSRTGQPLSIVEQGNKKQAAQLWAYMVSLGMIGLGLGLLYKDDEEYEEISDYLKATHWLFRVDGEWVRIPKPFELAFFSNLVERTFDYVYKDDPTAVDRFVDGLFEITVPPHSVPGIMVSAELITDHSFFSGRPIVGPFLKNLPPELRFNAYASEFSKYLGKQVGISPAYIDHFITGFGASYGREFVNASDMFMPALGKATGGALGLPTGPVADPALQDYFFIRRFTTDPTRGSNSVRQFWDMMAMENGTFIQAASGYKHLVDKVRDAKGAQEFLDRLPDEERAYALLEFGNSGSRAKYRGLHPMNRAQEIVTVAGGMKKDINLNRLYEGKDGDPIELSPQQMRTVSDLLSDISMREARNALIALKVRGWEQKKPLRVDTVFDELEAAAPKVHQELVSRLNSKKLPSYQDVVAGWPIARERILEEGQDALINDLYIRDFSIGEGAPLQ